MPSAVKHETFVKKIETSCFHALQICTINDILVKPTMVIVLISSWIPE